MTEPHRTSPRQRSRFNFFLLIMLAFLLIAASVVLVLSIPKSQTLPLDTQPSDSAPAKLTGFDTDAVEAQQLYPFAAGVVKVTANRIAYLDLTGAEVFTVDAEMSAPFVVIEGKRFLVADKDGHSYILLSPEGEICRGSRPGILRGAAVAPDGHFALVSDPADSTGVVSLFEPKGQWLFDGLFPDSGFVLSVSFTRDSKAFDVSLLNTDGATVHPILKRFTFAGVGTGQRILDDTMIYPLIVYDQSGQPVLCGSTGLVALSYDKEEPLYRLSFPAIHTVVGSDSGLLILAAETPGGRQMLTVRPASGKQSSPIDIGDDVTDIAISGRLAAIGSGTRVIFVDLERQTILDEQNMAADVIRVGFAQERTVTIVTRSGVHQVAIPK